MKSAKMKIKVAEKLVLRRDTVLVLTPIQLVQVAGGQEEARWTYNGC